MYYIYCVHILVVHVLTAAIKNVSTNTRLVGTGWSGARRERKTPPVAESRPRRLAGNRGERLEPEWFVPGDGDSSGRSPSSLSR